MAHKTIDEALVSVREADTLVDGMIAVLAVVKQNLKDEIAKNDPAMADKIDEVFSRTENQKAKVAAAMIENTDIPPDA